MNPLHLNIQFAGVNEMVEATGKKNEKEMTNDEFFAAEINKVGQAKISAAIKGWAIFGIVMIIEHFFLLNWGWLGYAIKLITVLMIIPFLIYFVWGREDIFFGSFPREGFTKAVIIGNELKGFLGCPSGKDFTKDWKVVDNDHPDAGINLEDISFLGMHIVWPWPFANIYHEETEWQQWDPTTKKAIVKRELLREFTLLPSPYCIEIINAKDANRLDVTLYTNVVMRIINPKKALFKQTTTWINIVKPIIQGGYVSYVKNTTLQDMIGKKGEGKDIGKELLQQMKGPVDKYSSLTQMLEEVYGIKIESISVLNIAGSEQDEQAIKAKAIAKLRKEAAIIKADANAQKFAIETMGAVTKMLAQTISETAVDEDGQKIEQTKAENILKTLLRDNPEEFERIYGEKYQACIDFVQRKMSLDKGCLIDVRIPKSEGLSGDLLAIIAASKLINDKKDK
ncbi:MAG: SPFH domain-containing protein [Minisyncoccales bacterium]